MRSSSVRSAVTSRSMALRLAAYSGEWTSSWVWNMAMVSPNDRQGARGDLAALLEQLPADQHSPDFTGAGADLVQLGITQQATGGVVIDIAVAPEDLDSIQRGAGRLFGGIEDHPGGVLPAGPAEVATASHGIQVGAAGVEAGIEVGDFALDQLKLANAAAELLAVVDVGQHHIQAGLHDPHRSAGQHHPFVVQPAHQYPRTAVDLAQHIGQRHGYLVEE